jgi:uncharacterized protein DUF4242
MTEFLVEIYVPRDDPETIEGRAERARRAGEEMTLQGTPVRYLRSLFVPEDETCFMLYEAHALADVREAAERAALAFDRISEAVEG